MIEKQNMYMCVLTLGMYALVSDRSLQFAGKHAHVHDVTSGRRDGGLPAHAPDCAQSRDVNAQSHSRPGHCQ